MNSDPSILDLQGSFEEPKSLQKTEALDITKVEPEVPITSNQLVIATAKNGSITAAQQDVLDEFMARASTGHQSVLALKCRGTKCVFLDICPLNKAQIELPLGKSCPVENSLIATWAQTTMRALDIDPSLPENAIDVNMAFELAGLEMIRYRAAFHMHRDPELVEERIIAYSPQGEPIYDEKPKMALLIAERYSKLISKLRDQLLATRRSQAQVGKLANDLSVKGANMIAKAKSIADKRRAGGKITEVSFEVINEPTEPTSNKEQSKPG